MSENPTPSLERLVADRVRGVHERDIDLLLSAYADDVEQFGVLPPLRTTGRDAVRETSEQWFAGYASPIGYDVIELTCHADGEVGFCSFVYRVTGTLTSGDDVDMTVRATLGCRRVDGRWLIVHDHESVPLQM